MMSCEDLEGCAYLGEGNSRWKSHETGGRWLIFGKNRDGRSVAGVEGARAEK